MAHDREPHRPPANIVSMAAASMIDAGSGRNAFGEALPRQRRNRRPTQRCSWCSADFDADRWTCPGCGSRRETMGNGGIR